MCCAAVGSGALRKPVMHDEHLRYIFVTASSFSWRYRGWGPWALRHHRPTPAALRRRAGTAQLGRAGRQPSPAPWPECQPVGQRSIALHGRRALCWPCYDQWILNEPCKKHLSAFVYETSAGTNRDKQDAGAVQVARNAGSAEHASMFLFMVRARSEPTERMMICRTQGKASVGRVGGGVQKGHTEVSGGSGTMWFVLRQCGESSHVQMGGGGLRAGGQELEREQYRPCIEGGRSHGG